MQEDSIAFYFIFRLALGLYYLVVDIMACAFFLVAHLKDYRGPRRQKRKGYGNRYI